MFFYPIASTSRPRPADFRRASSAARSHVATVTRSTLAVRATRPVPSLAPARMGCSASRARASEEPTSSGARERGSRGASCSSASSASSSGASPRWRTARSHAAGDADDDDDDAVDVPARTTPPPSPPRDALVRDDELVLVLGCAPGPAKYFGITPYLYRAYQGASARTLFASLGDSLSAGVAGDVTTTDASAAAAAGGLSPARRFARLATSGTGPIPKDSSGRLGVTRDADANCWNGQFAVAVGKHRATLDRAVEILRGRGLQQVFAAGGDGLYNTTPVTAYGLSR